MRRLMEASSDLISVEGAKLINKYGTSQSEPASEIYSPVLLCFSVGSGYISLFFFVTFACYRLQIL